MTCTLGPHSSLEDLFPRTAGWTPALRSPLGFSRSEAGFSWLMNFQNRLRPCRGGRRRARKSVSERWAAPNTVLGGKSDFVPLVLLPPKFLRLKCPFFLVFFQSCGSYWELGTPTKGLTQDHWDCDGEGTGLGSPPRSQMGVPSLALSSLSVNPLICAPDCVGNGGVGAGERLQSAEHSAPLDLAIK